MARKKPKPVRELMHVNREYVDTLKQGIVLFMSAIGPNRHKWDIRGISPRGERRIDARELREPMLASRAETRKLGGFFTALNLAAWVKNRYFEIALEELKVEQKIIVRPVMSTEVYTGHRRGRKHFDKESRRWTDKPWVVGYVYVYCESVLEAMALSATASEAGVS